MELLTLGVRGRRIGLRGASAAIALVALTAVFFGPMLAGRLKEIPGEEGALAWRAKLWRRALEEWSWSPVVGEGLGWFNDVERQWSGPK